MKKNILVIGAFGFPNNSLDGQTVKTRDVYRLIQEQYGDTADYFDTSSVHCRKSNIFLMFLKIFKCKALAYLPAHNNLKYLFPVIYILSILFRFKIHYFVVGGWLREYLTNLPIHRWMLHRIEGIHVETHRLEAELKEYYNFQNVDIFPNFRFFDFDPKRYSSGKLRLVFMARVNKMKGLDWIFTLADYIYNKKLENHFSLTFFGQLNKDDEEYFNKNLSKYPFAEYKGALEPSQIYETLCHYDVLLLPTHYYTEGLPGSVVDAYISGIPVIVTEWKHAHEFVEDGISGFIVPFDNGQDEFINKVMLLERDRSLLHQLQANALQRRMQFAPPSIDKMLNLGG